MSVNPYEKIEKLYSDDTVKSYKGTEIYKVQPHVYARESFRIVGFALLLLSSLAAAWASR